MRSSTRILKWDWDQARELLSAGSGNKRAMIDFCEEIEDKGSAVAVFTAGLKLEGISIDDFLRKAEKGDELVDIPLWPVWQKAEMLGADTSEVEYLYSKAEVPGEGEVLKEGDDYVKPFVDELKRYGIPSKAGMTGEGFASGRYGSTYWKDLRSDKDNTYQVYEVTLFPDIEDVLGSLTLKLYITDFGSKVILINFKPLDVAYDMRLRYGMRGPEIIDTLLNYLDEEV